MPVQASADAKLPRPARDGVLIEAEPGRTATDEVPGEGAATEGLHLVPTQVPPPAADEVPRRTRQPSRQQGEAAILHRVEVEQALQTDHQAEDAGQQAALQGVVRIDETVLRRGQPAQGLGHQQEGTGILCPCEEKGGGGNGTGRPAVATSSG